MNVKSVGAMWSGTNDTTVILTVIKYIVCVHSKAMLKMRQFNAYLSHTGVFVSPPKEQQQQKETENSPPN